MGYISSNTMQRCTLVYKVRVEGITFWLSCDCMVAAGMGVGSVWGRVVAGGSIPRALSNAWLSIILVCCCIWIKIIHVSLWTVANNLGQRSRYNQVNWFRMRNAYDINWASIAYPPHPIVPMVILLKKLCSWKVGEYIISLPFLLT